MDGGRRWGEGGGWKTDGKKMCARETIRPLLTARQSAPEYYIFSPIATKDPSEEKKVRKRREENRSAETSPSEVRRSSVGIVRILTFRGLSTYNLYLFSETLNISKIFKGGKCVGRNLGA